MLGTIGQRLNAVSSPVRGLPRRTRFIITIVLLAVVGLVVYRLLNAEPAPAPPEKQLPTVRLQSLADLSGEATVAYRGLVEPALAGPLVARTGGRVTAIRYSVGERVTSGSVVLEIDGRTEPSPGRAQVAGLQSSVALFDASEKAARAAADTGLRLAQENLKLAQATGPVSQEVAAIARRQADTAVRAAELAFEDAQEAGQDQAIRAADIALKHAGFAQDQATISRQLATTQQRISLSQARLNVESAERARETTVTQLASQRQQLVTQLQVSQETLRLQQVLAPLAGEVTRLTVRLGDFVQPGAVIGEVNAFAGAIVRLEVSTSVHNRLAVGQMVELDKDGTPFSGRISHVASAPSSTSGLWQVDVLITSTPIVIHPSELVTVHVPVGAIQADTYFLPLRVLTVRQDGALLFTVDDTNHVRGHPVEIIAFSGDAAEVRVTLAPEVRVVIEGNRTINDGDEVRSQQ